MAITVEYNDKKATYYGLSTDDKPTGVDINSLFYEYDTKTIYIWDGTQWWAM